MKKKIIAISISGLLVAIAAYAAGPLHNLPTDNVRIGVPSSSDDKDLFFNVGDGSSNPKISVDKVDKDFTFNKTTKLKATTNYVGDGTAANQQLIFDKGSGASNPRIRWDNSRSKLAFSNDGTLFKDIGSGSGSGSAGVNTLDNPGFEDGSGTSWTNSGGTYAEVTSGANLLFGEKSVTFDASATSQYFESASTTIPKGLYARSCQATIYYQGGDSNLKLQVLDGSSAAIPGASDFTLSAVTVPTKASIYFPCPTSGNFKLRIASTANAAIAAFDNAHLGESSLTDVSQATLVGTLTYGTASNCAWNGTSASFTNFAADTDCPAATVTGQLTAPGTKIPGFVATLPPGDYFVMLETRMSASTSSGTCAYHFTDGTNDFGYGNTYRDTTGGTSSNIMGHISYSTSQASRTFQVQFAGSNGSVNCSLPNESLVDRFKFSVYRYPTVQEQVFRPETLANSWSGYHDGDCGAWSRTNTAFGDPAADGTCTFTERTNRNFGTVTSTTSGSDKLPGIIFTPTRPGRYYICAHTGISGDTLNAGLAVILSDGTTGIAEKSRNANPINSFQDISLCGIYNETGTSPRTISLQSRATSGAVSIGMATSDPAVEWSIFQIDQALPAPVLVGGMTTADTTGLRKFAGFIGVVNGASSSIVSQTGNVFAYSATGANNSIITWSIAANTFSAVPNCTCTTQNSGDLTTSYSCHLGTVNPTSVQTVTRNADASTAASGASVQVHVQCFGN